MESHREHIKHELGRQSSINMVCIIRVPLTPYKTRAWATEFHKYGLHYSCTFDPFVKGDIP